MSTKLNICHTGFASEPKIDDYEAMVEKLNCKISKKLHEQIQLLIVNNTATQKYKIAKLKKDPVQCVTIKWLLDSKKKKKLLPYTNYEIPSIFYGVTVGVAGFCDEESHQIIKELTNNGAYAQAVESLPDFIEKQDHQTDYDVIVTNKQQLTRLGKLITVCKSPLVGLEWIQSSLNSKLCKWPNDFALNYQCLKQPIDHHIPRMNHKLSFLLTKDLFDKEFQFLSEVRVFMDQNISAMAAPLLKKVICATGGIYLDRLSPAVTHIVVQSISEFDFNRYRQKHGCFIKIVRVEWLIDSVYLGRKSAEEDYEVRQFECKYQRMYSNDFELGRAQSNMSYNNYSLPFAKGALKSSISMTVNHIKPLSKRIKTEKLVKFESKTFNKQYFYIDSTQKKDKCMNGLAIKIKDNGGSILQQINKTCKSVYLVLNDSQQNEQIFKNLEQFKEVLKPVSYRWINYCIQKCEMVSLDSRYHFVFRPLSFKTPAKQFVQFKIEILTTDQVAKKRVRSLLDALGNPYTSVKKADVTHCICLEGYKDSQKYTAIMKINPSAKFVQLDWILACINQKRIVQTTDFQYHN